MDQTTEKTLQRPLKANKILVWIAVVALSIIGIVGGNKIAAKDLIVFDDIGGETVKATVVKIGEHAVQEENYGEGGTYSTKTITFECKVKGGIEKGNVVKAQQVIDDMYAESKYLKPVEVGDSVMLYRTMSMEGDVEAWYFTDYYRLDKVLILFAVFAAAVLVLGRWKGVNTLLSLTFTFAFVFFVFVPSIMNGYNIYISAVITCIYTIVMTLLLINGLGKKTYATITGCVAGTMIAAGLTMIMRYVLHLTGFVDEHSMYLTLLNPENPIDLTAIIFAAIIIGAMGAIMDVAMDIASALYELTEHVPDMHFKSMFKSGISIGRDIMGTMSNTLVLAYIGSSLSSIMLLLTYSSSMLHLLNREVIITEILQALIGSLAILLTIPFTIAACGILYLKKHPHQQER